MNNIAKFVYEAVSRSSAPSRWSLKRRLFSYMMLLVCLLLLFLVTALFLTDQFDNIEENTYDALEMQIKVFEKDITDHFDAVAAAGISLSQTVTELVEDYLTEHDLRFSDLTDNADAITALQSMLLKPMLQQLSQENCSGIYVILDATVNSSLAHAAHRLEPVFIYRQTGINLPIIRSSCSAGTPRSAAKTTLCRTANGRWNMIYRTCRNLKRCHSTPHFRLRKRSVSRI